MMAAKAVNPQNSCVPAEDCSMTATQSRLGALIDGEAGTDCLWTRSVERRHQCKRSPKSSSRN